ncbi:MAG: peptide-methionine (S)-S-oxide reductase MsrA [Enterobacterales bacterium]|nr:peptide-methionine (S)-S-oxide reductase MsrA [Enterobacterales bacterium]
MTNQLILGGGCFWCLEAVFSRVKGVLEALPGYCGDNELTANYSEVCGGNTQHAEVVKLAYDPQLINLKQLLEIFFHIHDPTTLNRQGNDIGTQYRSILLFSNTDEKQEIEHYINQLQKELASPIVTQVVPSMPFYPAEIEHHDYYERNQNQPYCQMVVKAKVDKYLQMKQQDV